MTRCLLALIPFYTSVLPTMTPFSSSAYWKGQKHYEGISKLVPCNEDASKVKESLVDLNFSFPTNNQSSEVLQPGKSTLNLPSTPVTPQFATILIFLGLIVFTVGTDQFNAAFQQPFAKRITVVPLIRYDADRILPRPTTNFLGTAIFSIVGSSSFISLGQAESRSAPIGTRWPSTTIIHFVPFPLLVFPTHGPLFCPRQRFLPNLTGLVGPVRQGI